MSKEIDDLIQEVVPSPLCVSDTAIRQLTPLLEELIRDREKEVSSEQAARNGRPSLL